MRLAQVENLDGPLKAAAVVPTSLALVVLSVEIEEEIACLACGVEYRVGGATLRRLCELR